MAKKVHIICAKCGNEDMGFILDDPFDNSGVYLSCGNCREMTSIEEWSEANDKPMTDSRT